jgi:hypothetical protein
MFVISQCVCVPGKPSELSLMFVVKAKSLPKTKLERIERANILAYFKLLLITDIEVLKSLGKGNSLNAPFQLK